MASESSWKQLHQTSDSAEVLSIVTTIAAMGFPVRSLDASGSIIDVAGINELRGPFFVEVHEEDHGSLLEVLSEILAEQREFDLELAQGKPWTLARIIVSILALAGVAIILWLSFMPRG